LETDNGNRVNLTVLVLEPQYEGQLGKIRTIPGWKAARYEDHIWLKGPLDNGKQQLLINSLPATTRYEMDAGNRLFPIGRLTPTALLEELDWLPLIDFLPLEIPISALPGILQTQMGISLIRSTNPKPASALQTSFEEWKAFVNDAPLIRLQQLQFAVSLTREVIVIGNPLPPIPGKVYWIDKNLLIPLGFDFDPPFLAGLIGNKAAAEIQEYILFKENGTQRSIPSDIFKPAERAVVRLINL